MPGKNVPSMTILWHRLWPNGHLQFPLRNENRKYMQTSISIYSGDHPLYIFICALHAKQSHMYSIPEKLKTYVEKSKTFSLYIYIYLDFQNLHYKMAFVLYGH